MTNVELEALAILIEECGEALQEAGKALRHGLESYHPDEIAKGTNRDRLTKELGDVRAAMYLLDTNGVISTAAIVKAARAKLAKLCDTRNPRLLHHLEVQVPSDDWRD